MKIVLLSVLALQAQHVDALVVAKSDVKPPPGVETVTHMKEPNGGYKKGSPLYNKQEGIEDSSTDKEKKKKTEPPVGTNVENAQKTLAAPGSIKTPSFYESLASTCIYAIFVLAFAYIHWRRMTAPVSVAGEPPRENLPMFTRCGFAYSLCDCANIEADWSICLWSWCCPIVQWASTASRSTTPFMSYWKAVVLMLLMAALSWFTYGITGLMLLAVLLARRRHLRKVYNHQQRPASWLEDFCLTFCFSHSCLCCQLVQEAREVEYANAQQSKAAFSTPQKAEVAQPPLQQGLNGGGGSMQHLGFR